MKIYKIGPMKYDDIPHALTLWHHQFDRYCKGDSFPDFWSGGKETIEQYLSRQIEQGNAIVAYNGGDIAGYMAWMSIDFHAERSAFLPIVGNAALLEDENAVFFEMYAVAAEQWVRENRFNHLWMTYDDDVRLRDMLYDLGFGSYVIDACQRTDQYELITTSAWKITQATYADVDAVLAIENESESNLLKTPTFLIRDSWKREDVIDLITNEQVFVAWDGNRIIGMLSLDTNQNHHFEHLTCGNSAGGTCAYIRPEYRRKGVGTGLLREAFAHCQKVHKPFLHVSFETANPNAIKFWPKYFKPAIRSVRRTINKDANTL